MAAIHDAPRRFGAWLARDANRRACGLAEASVRSDYVIRSLGRPGGMMAHFIVARLDPTWNDARCSS
jgi:hypothetical protein